MNDTVTSTRAASRQTKYATAVVGALRNLEHATNKQLLDEVKQLFPEVSATTIHRVTARLKDRGLIGCAPRPANGAERFDATPEPHNHFMCVSCERVCDVPDSSEARSVMEQIKALSGDCALAGTLTLKGVCRACTPEEKE
jgi:Fur family transcriptional regulator, peroxide stress response regulator